MNSDRFFTPMKVLLFPGWLESRILFIFGPDFILSLSSKTTQKVNYFSYVFCLCLILHKHLVNTLGRLKILGQKSLLLYVLVTRVAIKNDAMLIPIPSQDLFLLIWLPLFFFSASFQGFTLSLTLRNVTRICLCGIFLHSLRLALSRPCQFTDSYLSMLITFSIIYLISSLLFCLTFFCNSCYSDNGSFGSIY